MGKIELSQRFRWLVKQPLIMAGAGVVLMLALSGAGYGVWVTQQPPPQPIQFNHELHVGLGVPCLYCHPGAWRQESPGLPTASKCWGCHQQIAVQNADQQKLADYVTNQESIPWVPVAIVPDFVHFNHRPHIAAGLNCENCHGELGRMTVAEPQKMDMGWCLDCHRQRAAGDPEKLIKLTDCSTCHR
jgi:hypothetical protein